MAKVTLNQNLFPCERPTDANALDLTDDLELADKLVRAAAQVFWLKKGRGRFSGFVSEADGLFSIELWRRERMLRALRFPSLGYSGTLFVDIEGQLGLTVGTDILGLLYATEDVLPEDLEGLEMIVEGTRDMPSLKVQSKKQDATFTTIRKLKQQVSRERIVLLLLEYLEGPT